MPSNETNPQRLLVTHAVLTGLTPLIPIPFVDDMVYTYLMRSMAQRLAALHGTRLSADQARTLADQTGGGCALGCLVNVLIYPLKKVLSKLFFFLEWKRATDIISHTYYHGYLVHAALEEGWVAAYGAERVRAAMNRVLERTDTSPLTKAVRGAVRQSKAAMRRAGRLLLDALRTLGRRPREADVAEAVNAVDAEEMTLLEGIINQLLQIIATLPAEHFQDLRRQLGQELTGRASTQ
jgi:hypothetical protein